MFEIIIGSQNYPTGENVPVEDTLPEDDGVFRACEQIERNLLRCAANRHEDRDAMYMHSEILSAAQLADLKNELENMADFHCNGTNLPENEKDLRDTAFVVITVKPTSITPVSTADTAAHSDKITYLITVGKYEVISCTDCILPESYICVIGMNQLLAVPDAIRREIAKTAMETLGDNDDEEPRHSEEEDDDTLDDEPYDDATDPRERKKTSLILKAAHSKDRRRPLHNRR
jgi:hypothetical protein